MYYLCEESVKCAEGERKNTQLDLTVLGILWNLRGQLAEIVGRVTEQSCSSLLNAGTLEGGWKSKQCIIC